MEFPQNTPTNVHKIEGILFIQWSVYSPGQNTLPRTDEHGILLEHPTEVLLIAEHELRRTGHHVYHEEPQGILWVFDLSGPNVKKEPRSDHQRGASTVVERYGLKRVLFGSLRASDLVDCPIQAWHLTDLPNYQISSWLTPASRDQKSWTHPGRSTNISQDNMSIYTKIISAISMSLSYFLVRSRRYISLSATLFLHMFAPELQSSNASGFDGVNRALYLASSLEVQWLCCGSLIILSYPNHGMGWRCLGSSSLQPSTPQNSTIVLSPFGTTASYISTDASEFLENFGHAPEYGEDEGFDTSNWSASSGSSKLKIISLLRRQGVQIPENCSWIPVRIRGPHSESTGEDTDEASFHIIEWPAQLCFHNGESDKVDGRGSGIVRQGLLDRNTDPLRDAETWFRERHERKMKIERRRLEIKTLSEKEAQASLVKEEGIEPGLLSGFERQNEVQGLSGIYPTPPDGFRSQMLGHSAELEASDPSNRQEDAEMQDQEDDSTKTNHRGGTPLDPLHGIGMSLGAYDGIEDEELFTNMDSAMFTANGITEDDFSFFDEPEASFSVAPTALTVPMDTENLFTAGSTPDKGLTSLVGEEEDNGVLADEDHAYNKDDYQPHGQDHNAQQTTDPPIDHETLHTNSSRQVSFLLPEMLSPATGPNHGNVDLKGIALPEPDTGSRQIPAGRRPSAFAMLPLKDLSQVVDRKYAGDGRFFAQHNETDDLSNAEPYKVEKAVPTIGFAADQKDDFDSESDDTYISETSSPPDIASDYLITGGKSSDPSSMQLAPQADDNPIQHNTQYPSEDDSFLSPTKVLATNAKTVSPQMLQMSDSPLVSTDGNGEQSQAVAGFGIGLYAGHDQDFIQVAQIMADQLTVYSTTKTSSHSSRTFAATALSKTMQYDDPLVSIVPALFPRSEICTLELCASTGETHRGVIVPPKAVIRPFQRRLESARGSVDHLPSSASIFSISTPYMRVLRGDALMELSATGLQFWEELGLSPCLGPKDITGYCVYPHTEMIHRGVSSFMDLLSMTYQSLRLGTHKWGHEMKSEFSNGFVPVTLSDDSMVISPSSIDVACERLGEVLVSSMLSRQTVLIYIINPFSKAAFVPRLCESFLRCLRKMESGVDIADQGELVLRLLPIEWVASRTTIPLPSPKEYAALARDVYDRCPAVLSSRKPSPFAAASHAQLAEAIPKTLDFKLSANPVLSLSRNKSALHVGYSWPRDSQWLCVSVVDTLGSLQWNASYCFGTAISEPWPTFREISKEIWRGILDMIEDPHASHLIYIIKDELLPQEEIDAWRSLSPPPDPTQSLTSSASHPRLSLILLAAEVSPPVYSAIQPPSVNLPDDPTLYATPASTPLATAPTPSADPLASPGFSSSGPRPADASSVETDPSARLIDVVDESWGIVSTRYFFTSTFSIPTAQPMGSGYLLKRAGVADEDGWVMMGVHVLWAEKWSEGLMRELLEWYRGLGTLARLRGVEARVGSVLPLHVAVARKSQKALREAMAFAPVE